MDQRQVNRLFEDILFIGVISVLSLSRPHKLQEDIDSVRNGSPFPIRCLALEESTK